MGVNPPPTVTNSAPTAPPVAGIRLTARSLAQTGGGKTILDAVSFGVEPGELVAVIGPSGSGKSTLLRLLCGDRRPRSGAVLYDGEDIGTAFDAYRGRIGYVPQDDILHAELTVRQALTYTARLRLPPRTPPALLQARVEEVIRQVELQERADLRIHRLSGGQRKRVSLAGELLAEPGVIFMDEPTSGLDPALEEKMMDLFARLALRGAAVLVTTHATASLGLAQLLLVVCAGRLVFLGPPDEALAFFGVQHPGDLFRKLKNEAALELQGRYMRSAAYQAYVKGRVRGVG